ncbi:MAG: flagellar basal body P-ring protein FlgI [Paracoccaceae bacterium]
MAEIRDGASLSEVVAGLNALGVSPRDMIDILKSITPQARCMPNSWCSKSRGRFGQRDAPRP